jgi:hypothetical protein
MFSNPEISRVSATSMAPARAPSGSQELTRLQCDWRFSAEHRLVALSRLKKGWDGHSASPVNRDALEFAAQVIAAFMQPRVPAPAIVPLADGGVQIEWHRRGWDLEISVLGPNNIYVYAYELASQSEHELEVSTDLSPIGNYLDLIKG